MGLSVMRALRTALPESAPLERASIDEVFVDLTSLCEEEQEEQMPAGIKWAAGEVSWEIVYVAPSCTTTFRGSVCPFYPSTECTLL